MKVDKLMILQPSYLPWLGYFEMLYHCDLFISYDTVQYTKNDWRNRNLIRTNTEKLWLTVPIQIKGQWPLPIEEVKINNRMNWGKKHLRSITQYYGKAPYFDQYYPAIEEEITCEYEFLQDLNLALIKKISSFLGFNRVILKASEMDLPQRDNKTEKLIDMCKSLGAKTYYATQASKSYIRKESFSEAGIELIFQDYKHPVYPQQFEPFIPYLSAIDLLFNLGSDSLENLLSRPKP